MISRTLSTIILWTIVTVALFYGKVTAGIILLTIISFLTQKELYHLLELIGYQPNSNKGLFLGVFALVGGYYLAQYTHWVPSIVYTEVSLIAVLAILIDLVKCNPQNESTNKLKSEILPTLFGFIFVPFLLQFYLRLAHNFASMGLYNWGIMLVVWLVIVAKFTDVGGLLIGKAIGQNKLAPHISPQKTWEGALGGILLSGILGATIVFAFPDLFPPRFTVFIAFIIALPISAISIISDLIESVIKRYANVKDSGKMIPGIGGAFDLSDSLLLSAPLGYLLLSHLLL